MKKLMMFIAGCSLAVAANAQRPEPEVPAVACLPLEANQAVSAQVKSLEGGDSVRLYFRRVHPNGALYFLEMEPTADGNWWAVFPKPEQREQNDLTDEWWEILQHRDWIADRERDEIEDYLDELDYEAAEYFVAIHDAYGNRVVKSPDQIVEVIDPDDCDVELTPLEIGYSRNLTVGETVPAQVGKPVFHWLCDGIVTRLGSSGIRRGDEICRACVVAAWFPVPVAAAALATGTTVHHREPRRVSDDQP